VRWTDTTHGLPVRLIVKCLEGGNNVSGEFVGCVGSRGGEIFTPKDVVSGRKMSKVINARLSTDRIC